MTFRRGHIYRVQLPDVEEDKSALLVSSNVVSDHLKPVVVQVTSTLRLRGFPTCVELRQGEGGLTVLSYALCHAVHTLEHDNIDDEPIGGMISARKMVEVEHAIRRALDLEDIAA
jgi:mRNA-degrading endonuclease toxin of MazEF toxin-antitoxin module